MFQKIVNYFKEAILDDYKFILFLIVFYIICSIPLNYYITIGGGISDVSSRIQVEDAYQSEGSFNISYVTQLDAKVLTYLLSYIIPNWEREDANLYKYSTNESLDDIQFRADLDLKYANSMATYWAYTMAGKEVEEISNQIFVIATYQDEYPSKFKIRDELLEVDGNHYSTVLEYRDYIQSKNIGDIVHVKVLRKDKEVSFDSEIYDGNGRSLIGVGLQSLHQYKTNPEVHIKFNESESGPSGGLISALEIYNQLTEQDLTKGNIIAGTGTIESDGTIGEIGGIEHKILGAYSAKAKYFICPGGDNYKDAKKYIKEKKLNIQLIQVDTFEDAIEKLESLS